MRRKKFADIKSSEDRQEFLQYMLDNELEKIRKKIYKYQRRNTLWHDVTIEEKDLTELKAAGQYEWDKDSEVHKIYIETRIIDEYLSSDYSRWYRKKYAKKQLINVIGHEITHAFVKERFEYVYSDIKSKNTDGSPIFLSTLLFLGYTSNHHCAYNFYGSKVWKDIIDLKNNNGTWDAFLNYTLLYIKDLHEIKEQYNKEHQLLGQSISFEFSSRGSGLRKMSQSAMDVRAWVKDKQEFRKMLVTSTTFEIGSVIYPEMIKGLLVKKLANKEKADIQITSFKKLICTEATQESKWVFEKEEIYNKYKDAKTAELIK